MSRPLKRLDRKPLIALVERAHRAMQAHMIHEMHRRGYTQARMAYNAVFSRLPPEGARAADMAALAGITRQSMGEVIREMVDQGLLEMVPDPQDRRAKLVRYTGQGVEVARGGYEHLRHLETRFAEEFGEDEFELVRDVLDRVVGLLEKIEQEAAPPKP